MDNARIDMANEALWVRSNLATYCGPGRHDFIEAHGAGPTVRWCARCFKEEPEGRPACMICDLPGEVRAEIRDREREAPPVAGTLCDVCAEGLRESGPIGGWEARFEEDAPARGERERVVRRHGR